MRLRLLLAAGLILAGCGGRPGKGTGGAPAPVDARTADASPDAAIAPEVPGVADAPAETPAEAAVPDAPVGDSADTAPAGPPAVEGLYAGFATTCAVFDNERIKCWGDNGSGQLGLGDKQPRGDRPGTMGASLPYVDLGPARVISLAIGAAHVCALLDYGQVSCWGDNTHGQLGAGVFQSNVGDEPDEMGEKLPQIDFGPGRRAISLAAGPHHNCAVLDGGVVKCWGNNNWGNLGIGVPGSAWPPEPGPLRAAVALGSGRTALAVSAGGVFGSSTALGTRDSAHNSAFSCALLDDLQIKCWGGDGIYGATGEPRLAQRGANPGELGDNLPALQFGRAARQVAMGAGHGCALLDGGQVRCWGNDHQQQLGRGGLLGTLDDRYVPVNFGPGHAATAVAVSGSTHFIDEAHSCAVLDDGSAACWGANWHGQLGQPACAGNSGGAVCRGGSINGPLPAIDVGLGRHVKVIAPGGYHTCALLDDGRVKCWGDNQVGQLGLEDTTVRGLKLGDMGDQLPPVSL